MKQGLLSVFLGFLVFAGVYAQAPEKGSFYNLYTKTNAVELSKYWKEEIKLYDVSNGMAVLDVGGNDGKLIIPLAIVCDTLDYYLEDINPDYFLFANKFLAMAKKKINPKANFALHQITGGDSTIPAKAELFNRIVVRETFHHFDYPLQMLKEFKWLLAPHGHLVISEPASQKNFKHCKLIPAAKLIAMAKSAGFRLVSSKQTKTDFIVYVFEL